MRYGELPPPRGARPRGSPRAASAAATCSRSTARTCPSSSSPSSARRWRAAPPRPSNPLYTAAELASQLRDSGARMVVTIPPFADRAAEAARAAGVETVLGFGDLAAAGRCRRRVGRRAGRRRRCCPTRAARPGCRRASSSRTAPPSPSSRSSSPLLTLGPADTRPRRRADVPLHGPDRRGRATRSPRAHGRHDAALRVRAVPAGDAGPSRDRDGDRPADRAGRSPAIPPSTPYDLSALRWVGCGAAPLDAPSSRRPCARAARLPGRAGLRHDRGDARPSPSSRPPSPSGSCAARVGALLPGTEARVVDPDTGADLGAGADGELLVRGPQLMRGYRGRPGRDRRDDRRRRLAAHRRPRRRRRRRRRPHHRPPEGADQGQGLPGRAGRARGRCSCTHPAVADAAVVGVPDEAAGERPEGVRRRARRARCRDEVMAWVAERVAPHKRAARDRGRRRDPQARRPARSCGASSGTLRRGEDAPCPSSPAAASPSSTATSSSSSSACAINRPGSCASGCPVFSAMRPMLKELERAPRVGLPRLDAGLLAGGPADRAVLALVRAPRALRARPRRRAPAGLARLQQAGGDARRRRHLARDLPGPRRASTRRSTATCRASAWPRSATSCRSEHERDRRPADRAAPGRRGTGRRLLEGRGALGAV